MPGELIDRITTLEIKNQQLSDPAEQAHDRAELAALRRARDAAITPSEELTRLTEQLRAVNEELWNSEDRLRHCERDGAFGDDFVQETRQVYLRNDRRAALKQQLNDLLKTGQGEPKLYADYKPETNGVIR
jgi:hypothetical protein